MRYIILICLQVVLFQIVHASVTMAGTRVVFPAENSDKTLQFSNNSAQPFFVQIWVNEPSDTSSGIKSTDFITNPQFFRINGNSGQTVRLFFSRNQELPKDKETLYYLNFQQIPALDKDKIDQNRVVLVVNSRMKIFYRPKNIADKIEDLPSKLSYRVESNKDDMWLEIYNPTGYYANLTQAFIGNNNAVQEVEGVGMIAPFSKQKWKIDKNIDSESISSVSITLVNDYGAYSKYQLKEKQ